MKITAPRLPGLGQKQVSSPSARLAGPKAAQADSVQFGAKAAQKKPHLINDVPYKNDDGTFNMVVEIPAGTNEKWETNEKTGQLYRTKRDNKIRLIQFLPYPGNYGFIPQTLSAKDNGGDGDPVDVMLLDHAKKRGSVQKVRVIGCVRLKDEGERDDKLIAVTDDGPFKNIKSLNQMVMRFPAVMEIIRTWFMNYDGTGMNIFDKYANRRESVNIIEAGHRDWERVGVGE
jgi:inorganic pyrophosphatase